MANGTASGPKALPGSFSLFARAAARSWHESGGRFVAYGGPRPAEESTRPAEEISGQRQDRQWRVAVSRRGPDGDIMACTVGD